MQPLFSTNEARGVLTYHLVDIPLKRFPDWMRAIKTFYEDRGRVYDAELV